MKILLTTDTWVPAINGVVTSTVTLRAALTAQGHEVRVLTLSGDCHTYTKDGVTSLGSLDAGLVYPGARLRAPALNRAIRDLIDWRPDIVHSQCEFSTFAPARRIAHAAGAPLIHTYHTVYEDYTHYFSPSRSMGRKMAALFTRMICAGCDAVIAPTPKISRLLAGYGVHCPVRIIPTGLDLQRFAVPRDDALRSRLGLPPKEANKTVLLSLGRLAKEKNTTELVDSMQNLPDAVLLIVGDGPERAVLEQQAQSLGVADRVIFVGAVPPAEVPRYYALGDVFVSASTSEAQGLTYIEAMAAGLPLLCHADPCLDALVREGETGWAYHTPAELAARAAALPKGHQLAAMRQNARRAVQPYTKEQFGLSVVRLYAAALGRKHAARSAAGGNVA